MEELVLWVQWVRPAVLISLVFPHAHRKETPNLCVAPLPLFPVSDCNVVKCSPSGSSSGPAAEASAIQRLEATLNNAAAAAVAAAEEAAASAEATEALRWGDPPKLYKTSFKESL